MKIATWNVNSIRARLDRVLNWLDEHQPDVLVMQETKVEDKDFPLGEFEDAGYEAAIHGQKTYNGVAILARDPISDVVRGFGDGGDDSQARCIAATVNDVRVVSVYVPNGKNIDHDDYGFKLEWLRRLRAYFDANFEPGAPIYLGGDFNVAPDERDVYDPKALEGRILCSDAEREALANLIAFGFEDAFRALNPDGGYYSWWDYRMLGFPKNRGLRIDMAYLTAPLMERCRESSIDRNARKGKGPSDHAPVLVTLS